MDNKAAPILAAASQPESESAALVLPGVLLSLVVVYLASKVGSEFSDRLGFPPVLGELVAGIIVGVSILHLLVFPEGGVNSYDFAIAQLQHPDQNLWKLPYYDGNYDNFPCTSFIESSFSSISTYYRLKKICCCRWKFAQSSPSQN